MEALAAILGMPDPVFVPFAFGALIVLLILLVVLTKPPDVPDFPKSTLKILRVFVALAVAAVAGGLTGFIDINGAVPGFAVQATGGLAMFVIVFVSLKSWGAP
ncbi:MAG TPA: hypothetical protein VL463_10140 [Kofleriaceae bacterium]|jgi:hypothetical protein|nr:hypothetical protein [Kofleriaceae bacterium]